MLMNVVAAMDLTEVDADWARIMCPVTGSALAAMAVDAVGGKEARDEVEDAGRVPGSRPDPPLFQVLASK